MLFLRVFKNEPTPVIQYYSLWFVITTHTACHSVINVFLCDTLSRVLQFVRATKLVLKNVIVTQKHIQTHSHINTHVRPRAYHTHGES